MLAPTILETRPRKSRVVREPSARQVEKALRKSSVRTLTYTWSRSQLPGIPVAKAGVPFWEAFISCSVVALLFVPVLLFSNFALWAYVLGGMTVTGAAYFMWARRVLIGEAYVAIRQTGRYHVANLNNLKHLELKPSARGGILCVHTDDGRCMRLRRQEVAKEDVNKALQKLWKNGNGTHDTQVAYLLGLPEEGTRVTHRYLMDAKG